MKRWRRYFLVGVAVMPATGFANPAVAQLPPIGGQPGTPDETRRLAAVAGQAEEAARTLGISRNTLQRALRRHFGANPRMSDTELVELIARVGRQVRDGRDTINRLREDIAAGPDADERRRAERLLTIAEAAYDAGRLDEARRGFGEVRALLRALVEVQRTRLDARVRSWIAAAEAEAAAALLQADFRGAADIYFAVLGQEPSLDTPQRWLLMVQRAGALRQSGQASGDRATFEEAVAIYRDQALPLAPRGERPADWAVTQNELGGTLRLLGTRLDRVDLLEQAAGSFNAAGEVYTEAINPTMWAVLQNNLGMTYSAIGQRTIDGRALEQAIAAFEIALSVDGVDANAFPRALPYNNLALALQALGARERSPPRLNRALQVLDAAEQSAPREQLLMLRTVMQNNRGLTLMTLGNIEQNGPTLERAERVFRDALASIAKEQAPAYWAAVQANLGLTLAALWEVSGSIDRLEAAKIAIGEALSVMTPETSPFEWGRMAVTFAVVDATLAQRTGELGRLVAAEAQVAHVARVAATRQNQAMLLMAQTAEANLRRIRAAMPQPVR